MATLYLHVKSSVSLNNRIMEAKFQAFSDPITGPCSAPSPRSPSSFVVSLVRHPSFLASLPFLVLGWCGRVCAVLPVLYVGNGFSGMGENGPKNERGSLYTYNNRKRNRGQKSQRFFRKLDFRFYSFTANRIGTER